MIEIMGRMLSNLKIAFVVFIIIPLLMSLGLDFYICTRTSNAGREFIDSARAQGKITEENLNEFYREVYRLGAMEITIDYEQLVSYPEGSGVSTSDYIGMSNDDLVDKVYEDHEFIMDHGDMLHLTIRQRMPGMASRFIELLTAQRIFLVLNDYGGAVF